MSKHEALSAKSPAPEATERGSYSEGQVKSTAIHTISAPDMQGDFAQETESGNRALDVATDALRRGWNPVPIRARDKKPIGKAWQDRIITTENVADHFKAAALNIGVQLGATSGGLTDIDLDSPEALRVASYFLPQTDCIFGRASTRCSHRFYRTTLHETHDSAAVQFKDPLLAKSRGKTTGEGDEPKKAMLLEVRIGGGARGAQTLIPGSIHPSGERYAFESGCDGDPARVDDVELLTAARRAAAAALLARYWPASGARHDARLALAGVLVRSGMNESYAKLFAEALAVAVGDDKSDLCGAITSTFKQQAEGKPITGRKALDEAFPREVAAAVLEWLDVAANRPNDVSGARAQNTAHDSWPDQTKGGDPKSTMRNAMVALQRMGKTFTHDVFRYRKLCDGVEVSDDLCVNLRREICSRFNFDPGKEAIFDAVTTLAISKPFHPIRDYLGGLEWDGVPRLDTWLTIYLGAEDTTLNRAIGRISLVAAVRRVRQPGVKFDAITVLEGMRQGEGKSTALHILAGADFFSDEQILTLDRQGQIEQLEGVWIFELSELDGIHKADVSRVKAFASRTTDRGRMAYGRFLERRPRQVVFFGSTNDSHYLRDETGNRRFWPVRTGKVDLDGVQRDRDQLWAEAAHYEALGDSIVLPEELWGDAEIAQEARMIEHPWLDALANIPDEYCVVVEGMLRITSAKVLSHVVPVPIERQTHATAKQVASLMRRLGWDGPRVMATGGGGNQARAYQRTATKEQVKAAKERAAEDDRRAQALRDAMKRGGTVPF